MQRGAAKWGSRARRFRLRGTRFDLLGHNCEHAEHNESVCPFSFIFNQQLVKQFSKYSATITGLLYNPAEKSAPPSLRYGNFWYAR